MRGKTFKTLFILHLISGFLGATMFFLIFGTGVSNNYNYYISGNTHNQTLYRGVYTGLMDSVVYIQTHTSGGSVSQGTGFVYDSEGRIVTNNHVVERGVRIEVRFKDGEWYEAKLVGKDVYSDIAVLEVDRERSLLKPLKISEVNPVPGEIVMALGSPYGLQGTITQGIVSGVNRSMETAEGFKIPDAVQTDAPINPGNSGGPLINSEGKVVGLNTARQGDNTGFAVSPTLLNRIVPTIVEKGSYRHPYLGVETLDVSPVLAQINDLKEARGVIVVSTERAGPSGRKINGSGLVYKTYLGDIPVGGDVIISLENRKIDSTEELNSYLIKNTEPGQEIEITVLRGGQRDKINVTLGRRPVM